MHSEAKNKHFKLFYESERLGFHIMTSLSILVCSLNKNIKHLDGWVICSLLTESNLLELHLSDKGITKSRATDWEKRYIKEKEIWWILRKLTSATFCLLFRNSALRHVDRWEWKFQSSKTIIVTHKGWLSSRSLLWLSSDSIFLL